MSYTVEYEAQDLHWQVIREIEGESVIIMRFTSRDQAEQFVERRIDAWSEKNNFEN
tara:strand:+ start:304 stop:471 length:168 start_codon:yes stop_codon:yes gene_type:complete